MSTRDEALFLLIYPNATKFVLLSIIAVIETTCLKIWAKPPAKNYESPLPVSSHALFKNLSAIISTLDHIPMYFALFK